MVKTSQEMVNSAGQISKISDHQLCKRGSRQESRQNNQNPSKSSKSKDSKGCTIADAQITTQICQKDRRSAQPLINLALSVTLMATLPPGATQSLKKLTQIMTRKRIKIKLTQLMLSLSHLLLNLIKMEI